MKTFIILALIAFANTQAVVSPVDTCLRSVKHDVDLVLKSAEFGLRTNWLDWAKLGLESMAEGIQSYEDCKVVQTSDALDWITAHATKHQVTCLLEAAGVYVDLKVAVDDMKNGSTHDKIMQDWLNTVTDLNKLAQTCMWE